MGRNHFINTKFSKLSKEIADPNQLGRKERRSSHDGTDGWGRNNRLGSAIQAGRAMFCTSGEEFENSNEFHRSLSAKLHSKSKRLAIFFP